MRILGKERPLLIPVAASIAAAVAVAGAIELLPSKASNTGKPTTVDKAVVMNAGDIYGLPTLPYGRVGSTVTVPSWQWIHNTHISRAESPDPKEGACGIAPDGTARVIEDLPSGQEIVRYGAPGDKIMPEPSCISGILFVANTPRSNNY